MPGTLVVVESPSKAKTIEKYLGGDYTVRASYGHIRDLPKSELGVAVDHGFGVTYVVPEDSKKHVAGAEAGVKNADDVILATDYDREGEAIAFHVATLLGQDPASAKRVTFTEITQDVILESFLHPRAIDLSLFDAQEARRVLDRLVGYQISPILWRRVRPGLSAGRVQSVAVRLIVEREREIQAFVPIEYWSVDVRLTPEDPEQPFVARLDRDPRGQARLRARQEGRAPRGRGRRRRTRGAPAGRAGTAWRRWSRRSASARPRRRSRPRRCSRRPPASSGTAPAARCRSPSACTRGSTCPARAASASSPTCGPTRSTSPTRRCARSPSS